MASQRRWVVAVAMSCYRHTDTLTMLTVNSLHYFTSGN